MKNFLFVVLFVACAAAAATADFKEGEYPVYGLNLDTPFTLTEHGWAVKAAFPDITAQIMYGITDSVQIGTRLTPYFTPIKVPNLSFKWNAVRESERMPAFSAGGSAGFAAIDRFEIKDDDGNVTDVIDRAELLYFNVTVYIGKKIGDFFISGSASYNKLNYWVFDRSSDPAVLNQDIMNTLKYYTGKEDPLGLLDASLVAAWKFAPAFMAVAEGLMLIEAPFAVYGGAGIIWSAGDLFRLEAGVNAGTVLGRAVVLPEIGISARF